MKQPTVAVSETIDFQLADLNAFLRVADHSSFSRAAAVLREGKGTVSRRIARLENQLGARLFQRTSRMVALSEAGLDFRQAARIALEALDQATARLHQSRDEPEGALRLTAPEDMAAHLVPGLVKPFLERHPRVRVEVVATDRVLDLASNQLDVALRAAIALPDSGYVAHRLIPLDAGLYAAPAYLADRGTPRGRPSEISAEHALCVRDGDLRFDRLRLHLVDDPRTREQQPITEAIGGRPRFQAGSYADVLAAAEEGLGIALLPNVITKNAVKSGRLRRVLPRYGASVAWLFLVYARGLLPARVRAFRDHVRATLRAPAK